MTNKSIMYDKIILPSGPFKPSEVVMTALLTYGPEPVVDLKKDFALERLDKNQVKALLENYPQKLRESIYVGHAADLNYWSTATSNDRPLIQWVLSESGPIAWRIQKQLLLFAEQTGVEVKGVPFPSVAEDLYDYFLGLVDYKDSQGPMEPLMHKIPSNGGAPFKGYGVPDLHEMINLMNGKPSDHFSQRSRFFQAMRAVKFLLPGMVSEVIGWQNGSREIDCLSYSQIYPAIGGEILVCREKLSLKNRGVYEEIRPRYPEAVMLIHPSRRDTDDVWGVEVIPTRFRSQDFPIRFTPKEGAQIHPSGYYAKVKGLEAALDLAEHFYNESGLR